MGRDPRSVFYLVFHRAVVCRAMAGLAHKPHQQSRTVIAGNREADSIAIAIDGQTRTFRGVAQIAKVV
jgi:hypothetical protein